MTEEAGKRYEFRAKTNRDKDLDFFLFTLPKPDGNVIGWWLAPEWLRDYERRFEMYKRRYERRKK